MYHSNTIKCLQNKPSMNKTSSTTFCVLFLCQAKPCVVYDKLC